MIIKNNFNDKNANPLEDYNGIGKGSHNVDKEIEFEKEGFIKENINNEVLSNLRDNFDDTTDDDDDGDKWKFFR